MKTGLLSTLILGAATCAAGEKAAALQEEIRGEFLSLAKDDPAAQDLHRAERLLAEPESLWAHCARVVPLILRTRSRAAAPLLLWAMHKHATHPHGNTHPHGDACASRDRA